MSQTPNISPFDPRPRHILRAAPAQPTAIPAGFGVSAAPMQADQVPVQSSRSSVAELLCPLRTISVWWERLPYFNTIPRVNRIYTLFELRPSDALPELVLSSVTCENLSCDVDGLGAYSVIGDPDPGAQEMAAPWGSRTGRGAVMLVGKNLPGDWSKLGAWTAVDNLIYPGIGQGFAVHNPGDWDYQDTEQRMSSYDSWRAFSFPPGKLSDATPQRSIVSKSFGPLGLRVVRGEALRIGVLFARENFSQTVVGANPAAYFGHCVMTLDFAEAVGGVGFRK